MDMLPFKMPIVTEMTSDELVSFVETRQKKRLEVVLAAHTRRTADRSIKPEVISSRLEKEHVKLAKALESYERAEDKVRKTLSAVIALRAQLGLEDEGVIEA
jgi:hypothetical protein